MSIKGLHFTATAIVNSGNDSVSARVAVANVSDLQRSVTLSNCGHPSLTVYRIGKGSRAVWSSEAWFRSWEVDETVMPDGTRLLHGCLAFLMGRLLAPGASTRLDEIAVPVAAILGDSLEPGRYRITIRSRGGAARAGELQAGEVKLLRR
jgi:hypothetical protein